MNYRLLILVLLYCVLPDALAGKASIPNQFHGNWAENCGQPMDTSLRLSAEKLAYHESVGIVKAVRTNGDYELFITARFSGEGETWEAKEHFVLAKDGKTLMSLMENGTLMKRMRCR